MAIRLGAGQFTYEVNVDWAKFPKEWPFVDATKGWSFVDVTDVAVDSKDRVYLLTRGEFPLIIFDRDGNFLSSWGKGMFTRPHGFALGPDDTLYCADDGNHTVKKFTLDGKLLMTIGTPGQPSPLQSGVPFNRPTKVALDQKTGDIYVSDGYGNSSVHKFSPDGKRLFSWGEVGTDPGQFNCVHNVSTDAEGYVYISDRENHRIQIFDASGKYLTQWNDIHKPTACSISSREGGLCFVAELSPAPSSFNYPFPNLGARVDIYNRKGERLARLGDIWKGDEPHQFWAPHGIAIDSRGDLYVAEVSYSVIGRHMDPPKRLRSFRKLVKVA